MENNVKINRLATENETLKKQKELSSNKKTEKEEINS